MGEIVRHKKTGGLYEVLFRGSVIHSDVPLYDDAPVTVCRRLSDDRIVARYGATPRDSFDVLHHSRLQTGKLLYDGDEVVVYRALGGGPVWTRPTSEMDDGRFEPAHPDSATPSGDGGETSSTPGEVERLVDALNQVYSAAVWLVNSRPHPTGDRVSYDDGFGRGVVAAAERIQHEIVSIMPDFHDRVAARDALLSHISTAGWASIPNQELAQLSAAATQGRWSGGHYREGSIRVTIDDERVAICNGFSAEDAAYVKALVNAHRAGYLVIRSAADAIAAEAPRLSPAEIAEGRAVQRQALAFRLQCRLDVMAERGMESVGISKSFAAELVHALSAADATNPQD